MQQFIVLTLAAVTSGVTALSPMGAQESAPTATACAVTTGAITEVNGYVTGEGSYSGCPGMYYEISVQRHRWYGWQTVRMDAIAGPDVTQRIGYNCLGTGIHDYRVHVEARTAGLSFKAVSGTLPATAC